MPGSLFGIGDQRVFNFGQRDQHSLAVGEERLFFLRVAHLDVGPNPAALKNWPGHGWTDLPHPARAEEEIAGTDRFKSDRAGNREFGIQVSNGDADAGRGRCDLALSSANVGTPPEQIGRQAGGNPHRDRIGIRDARNRRHVRELRLERVGLATKQHADAMDRLRQLALEFRYLRLRRLEQRPSLEDVELRSEALLETGVRQLQ